MLSADIIARIVAMANETREFLTGDFAEIRLILNVSDVVFAVWQDAREPHGVGILLIQGQQRLRESVADASDCICCAIPCVDAKQAEALRQVAGERDRRH